MSAPVSVRRALPVVCLLRSYVPKPANPNSRQPKTRRYSPPLAGVGSHYTNSPTQPHTPHVTRLAARPTPEPSTQAALSSFGATALNGAWRGAVTHDTYSSGMTTLVTT